MSATTMTSFSSKKSDSKDLCIICESQPYDLICTCGDKFDFTCIHQHVEQIGREFQDHFETAREKLAQIKSFKDTDNNKTDAARKLIENWKRKRLQDINDIADDALDEIQQRKNEFDAIKELEETYNQLSQESHRIVHGNLNIVISLNQQIKDNLENYENLPTLVDDDTSLDTSLQSKLTPSVIRREIPVLSSSPRSSTLDNQVPSTNANAMTRTSLPSIRRTEPTDDERFTEPTDDERFTEPTYIERSTEPTVELTNTTEPTVDLTNTVDTTESITDTTNADEFDAGETRHIQRTNPLLIAANNDQFAATICSHNNQLLYNDYDRTSQTSRLTFIGDIQNPRSKQIIEWTVPDTTTDGDDDEWIQDIIYSEKLSGYLLLNRTRLRVFNDATQELNECHVFNNRKMKRLTCNSRFIYLTSSNTNIPSHGDEIVLMNYDKEEQLCKTFRDIIPSRINRGAGPVVGEISDIAVGANDQVVIGYRLERRQEVGVCLFNVTNDGKEWSCVKQLLLNDCWHSNLSYTPRIDWSEKLNIFILIEYITGHLIMIDRDGQVEGECRFMHVQNRQESPINLALSANDHLCVRYASSISIHKILP